jgi:hypothetical protein
MRSPRQALTICVWLACHLPQPVVASTVLFQSDAQLLARSARVVHARVLNLRTERGTNSAGRIYTVTTLEVLEDFTGQVPERLEVWELGGALGDQILYVGGQVQYRVGQEVLVCLERGPQGWRSMAMGFSKFDVVRTSSDDGTLRRNVQDTASGRSLNSVSSPRRSCVAPRSVPRRRCRRQRSPCRSRTHTSASADGDGETRMPIRR